MSVHMSDSITYSNISIIRSYKHHFEILGSHDIEDLDVDLLGLCAV